MKKNNKMSTIVNIVDQAFVEENLKCLFQKELVDMGTWKIRWKKIGNVTLGISKTLVATALLLDFIAGFYKNENFTFMAGCSNTLALTLMAYSSYAYTEAKKRNNNLYKLLLNNNIQTGYIRQQTGEIINPVTKHTYVDDNSEEKLLANDHNS